MNHVYRVKVWDSKTGELSVCTWISQTAKSVDQMLVDATEFYPGRRVEVEGPKQTGNGFGPTDFRGSAKDAT